MAPYGTPGSFWTQEAAASNLGIALLPRADETWAPFTGTRVRAGPTVTRSRRQHLSTSAPWAFPGTWPRRFHCRGVTSLGWTPGGGPRAGQSTVAVRGVRLLNSALPSATWLVGDLGCIVSSGSSAHAEVWLLWGSPVTGAA